MTDQEKIDLLLSCLRRTLWMAGRYAEGRMTYAPDTFNDVIQELDKNGFSEVMEPDKARNGDRYLQIT